jgi:hypothetical protein
MARRTKDVSGRVTPKGGSKAHKTTGRVTPPSTGRYTPPVPKEYKESPRWVPVLLITFLILGMITILTNYLGLLPGGASNGYLLLGLGLITLGFITATRFR